MILEESLNIVETSCSTRDPDSTDNEAEAQNLQGEEGIKRWRFDLIAYI